jgi:hypothetical protein
MTTGTLSSREVVRKCSSKAWSPASIASNPSGPMAIIVDRPMAEVIEHGPPTQSENSNMWCGSIPNWVTPSLLVDTATK